MKSLTKGYMMKIAKDKQSALLHGCLIFMIQMLKKEECIWK